MIVLYTCDQIFSIFTTNMLIDLLNASGKKVLVRNVGSHTNCHFVVPPPKQYTNHFYGDLRRFFLNNQVYMRPEFKVEFNRGLRPISLIRETDLLKIELIENVNEIDLTVPDSDFTVHISVRFHQIFNQIQVQKMNNMGISYNIHGGALPKYPGLMIPYHAHSNAEVSHGWSVHHLTPNIDAGKVIFSRSVNFCDHHSVFGLEYALAKKVSVEMAGFLNNKACIQNLPIEDTQMKCHRNLSADLFSKMEGEFPIISKRDMVDLYVPEKTDEIWEEYLRDYYVI